MVQNISLFLQKDSLYYRNSSTYGTNLAGKCQEGQIPYNPLLLCYKTHNIITLHEVDRICKKL